MVLSQNPRVTDRRTDRQTNRQTDGGTDGQNYDSQDCASRPIYVAASGAVKTDSRLIQKKVRQHAKSSHNFLWLEGFMEKIYLKIFNSGTKVAGVMDDDINKDNEGQYRYDNS